MRHLSHPSSLRSSKIGSQQRYYSSCPFSTPTSRGGQRTTVPASPVEAWRAWRRMDGEEGKWREGEETAREEEKSAGSAQSSAIGSVSDGRKNGSDFRLNCARGNIGQRIGPLLEQVHCSMLGPKAHKATSSEL
ncbi:hypothetical protein SEVIR_1G305550v4 [Setaria viridis]|uniref:Uncharacterized protein n=1 Tax=Setaria viridis TaxID=4556 RepID=A0A4U6WGG7_SETVI|nr:hypothetical protein SEVIR_1G305550v2 [Setaria viridis]